MSRTLQATLLPPKCCHGERFSVDKAHQLGINRFRNDHSFHKGQCFIKVNGDPTEKSGFGISSEWTTNSCDTVDAISTAVARLITRHSRIPNECLSLVWSKPQDHHVVVTIVLTPLSDGVLHDWAMQTSPLWGRGGCPCMVCCHPCNDADDDPDPKARERNCVECHPCNLCGRCRVTMANGLSLIHI